MAVGNGSMHRWLALAVKGGELSAHGRVAVSPCMQGRSSVAIKGGELSAHGRVAVSTCMQGRSSVAIKGGELSAQGIGALGEAPW